MFFLVSRATGYGPENEVFTFWPFITAFCSLFNMAVAYMSLRISNSHEKAVEVFVPQKTFALIALLQSSAMVSSLKALDNIDYPTALLGKCAKPLAILVVGLLFFRKQGSNYGMRKILVSIVVCIGIAMFMLGKPGLSKKTQEESDGMWMGYMYLIASLTCDGFIGGVQKGLSSLPVYRRPKPHQMMLYINFWSVLLLFSQQLATGGLFDASWFLMQHPAASLPLLGMGMCLAVGQLFIYMLLTDFDPLVTSLTTTTRKFFSILASVVVYGHAVAPMQWAGVSLVFGSLLFPTLFDFVKKQLQAEDKPYLEKVA